MHIKKLLQLTHLKIAEWFLTAPYKKWKKYDKSVNNVFIDFVNCVNQIPQAKVLEIGSRNVSGSVRKHYFSNADGYVGFDFHSGENVDVVGDAHELSRLLDENSFDAVFCFSVFEHIAMPWKLVIEINKILKPGGMLFIATHPCWPPHELPWDFWRFQPEAFNVLLNSKTGFQLEQCFQGEPAKIIPLVEGSALRSLIQCETHLSVAVLAKKVFDVDDNFAWDFPVNEIILSNYPDPK